MHMICPVPSAKNSLLHRLWSEDQAHKSGRREAWINGGIAVTLVAAYGGFGAAFFLRDVLYLWWSAAVLVGSIVLGLLIRTIGANLKLSGSARELEADELQAVLGFAWNADGRRVLEAACAGHPHVRVCDIAAAYVSHDEVERRAGAVRNLVERTSMNEKVRDAFGALAV